MTVPYTREVPNGSSFGVFWKVLKLWHGSVYKLIWRELMFYLAMYYSVNVVYHYVMDEEQKIIFEDVRRYIAKNNAGIPLSFVLGFYVSLVVKRWWEQFRLLPWPDTLALFISAAIPGNDEVGRMMRRNIVRYMMLSYVITLRTVSLRVKKRFPEWQHLVDAGFMHESEKKIFELMDAKHPMSKYWMPLVWATNIINRARKDGQISSDQLVQTLLLELSDIRVRLSGIHGYDFVCVPLVYTQVVTIALYTYFGAALLGSNEKYDLYFPVFLVLQFVFYVGWLKVAEVLINPWGEDDDDIELNWFIDRHTKAAYMIVDEMHEEHPELLKDQFWEEVVPQDLLYTVGSEYDRRYEPKGSAEDYKVKEDDAIYANLSVLKGKRDSLNDYEFIKVNRKNWLSRQLQRMGSDRSSISSNRFDKSRSPFDLRLPQGESGRNSPSKSRKSSIYERILGYGHRKFSVSDYSKPEIPISIVNTEPPALPPYTRGKSGPSVIGRLLLTPMGTPNHFILPAGPASTSSNVPMTMTKSESRLETTAEEGSVDSSPVMTSTDGSTLVQEPPPATVTLKSEKDDGKDPKEVFV